MVLADFSYLTTSTRAEYHQSPEVRSLDLPKTRVAVVAAARFHLRPLRRIHLARRAPALRLGPVVVAGQEVALRSPRLSDAAAWREIRLRDQRLIEPYWVSSALSWPERHTEAIWVDECSSHEKPPVPD